MGWQRHRQVDRPTLQVVLAVWLEPRLIEGAPALARGRARNPATGHERAVKSTSELGAFVDGEIEHLATEPWTWEGASPSPAGSAEEG